MFTMVRFSSKYKLKLIIKAELIEFDPIYMVFEEKRIKKITQIHGIGNAPTTLMYKR